MEKDMGCGRNYVACAIFLYLLVSMYRVWAGVLF